MRFSLNRLCLHFALLAAAGCAPKADVATASVAPETKSDAFAAPIVLAAQTAEPRFSTGDALSVDVEVCLADGETLTLLDAQGEHTLAGPGCAKPVKGNFVADRAPVPEVPDTDDRALRVAGGSAAALVKYPAEMEIRDAPVCLKADEQLEVGQRGVSTTLTGPGCYPGARIAAELARKRDEQEQRAKVRQQVARKSLQFMYKPPPPEQFYIYRGSASALARYPRGTSKAKYRQICLKGSERLTLVSKTGRKITYGKGCDKRIKTSDDTNSGATSVGSLRLERLNDTGIGE